MSVLSYVVDKLKTGLITFINAVILANRDYPYHDYKLVSSTSVEGHYIVGNQNLGPDGTQHKFFCSKSTLIYATEDATVRFNSSRNVAVVILAGTWYEFKSNIHEVFWVTPSQGYYIYMYFEGVLPQEQRSAE